MSTAVATPGVAEVPPGAEPVLETENLVKVYGRGGHGSGTPLSVGLAPAAAGAEAVPPS